MHIIWCWREISPSFFATMLAVIPLIPLSISSKMRVGIISEELIMFLKASMILDISPPDAILYSGFRGSPRLVEIRISTLSIPSSVGVSRDSTVIFIRASLKLRSASSARIFDSSSEAISFLIPVRALQASINLSLEAISCFSRRCFSSSKFSIFSSFDAISSLYVRISSMVEPYFFLRLSI